ncbi:MAG: SDR family oxidoreductase [Pseudomonadota bacterium]
MPTLVITGANRGIGLALARRYAEAGWTVHATARNPTAAAALAAVPGTKVHALDVADQASIEALAEALDGVAVDHLINNAGVMGPRSVPFGESQSDSWAEVLAVNVAGPWMVTERLVENLKAGAGKRVGILSSHLGSLADAGSGWSPIYAASKTAANMVMRQLSFQLAPAGIVVLSFHPGWVQTEMGGADALVRPEDSAAALFGLMNQASPEQSGGFFNYTGERLPW